MSTADADIQASAAEVARALSRARRVAVITGAGISAESGLPTYRGVGGLYDDGDTGDGLSIEDALSGAQFDRDPAVTWKYLWQIGQACRGAQPADAHRRIASWERPGRQVTVLTQNIDGFHRAAGSSDVIEMHGNMARLLCIACAWTGAPDALTGTVLPPSCPDCGAVIRPDVVLFGEMLPDAAITAYDVLMASEPDLVISIGTTSVFPYIAAPMQWARRWGGMTVEINPQRTAVSDQADVVLRCRAGQALAAIAAALTD